MRLRRRLVLVLFCALLAAGCPRSRGPSFLLVSVDSLRSDHVHALGYARETTPVLDGLVREGTVWTGVVSAAPWTTPSMMSVMTGLYPEVHHVDEDDRVLAPGVETLAQRFQRAGYATAGFVPEATLTASYGFARGFDHYEDGHFGHRTVTSPAQSSSVIHWLEQTSGPFFAWVHLWDPHFNYNPPSPYDRKFPGGDPPPPGTTYDMLALKDRKDALGPDALEYVRGQYDGEIAFTDHYIGEILDTLRTSGRLDSTLVVVVGDHGEAFQEHGWLTHTNTVYEETVRVPVIARLPGRVPAKVRVGGARSLVDLTASVASWAGLPEIPTQSRGLPTGEAALPAAGGARPTEGGEGAATAAPPPSGSDRAGAGETARLVVSTTRRLATVLSVRSGRWSLVLEYGSCRAELYDLESDPGQTRDLAAESPNVVADLKSRLKDWIVTGRREHQIAVTKLEQADPELYEKLVALGYAGKGVDRITGLPSQHNDRDPLACL